MTENHGYIAEDNLHEICNAIFGHDLVARSPTVKEESGEKELADILIDLYDSVFVFQSKSINIDIDDLTETKVNRILKKISHAQNQFQTFLSAEKYSIEVKLENSLGIRYKLDWNKIVKRVGIITLNINDKLYDDPEFRFQIPKPVVNSEPIEIHVFILKDLRKILEEYNTPIDFSSYLTLRSGAINTGKLLFGNELDFVAALKTQYPDISEYISEKSKFDTVFIEPGTWEGYEKNKEVLRKKKKLNEGSKIFNDMFNSLGKSIKHEMETKGITQEDAIFKYRLFVSNLSKVGRFLRYKFEEKILEKILRLNSRRFSYFVSIIPEFDLSILFVATNYPEREQRIIVLENLCLGASHVISTGKILGISGWVPRSPFILGYDYIFGNSEDLKNTDGSEKFKKFFKSIEKSTHNEWDVD